MRIAEDCKAPWKHALTARHEAIVQESAVASESGVLSPAFSRDRRLAIAGGAQKRGGVIKALRAGNRRRFDAYPIV